MQKESGQLQNHFPVAIKKKAVPGIRNGQGVCTMFKIAKSQRSYFTNFVVIRPFSESTSSKYIPELS